MQQLVFTLGWSVLLAVPPAAAVWVAGRTRPLRQRPALLHALWLVVLVKTVTPSLIRVPVLPAVANGTTMQSNQGPASTLRTKSIVDEGAKRGTGRTNGQLRIPGHTDQSPESSGNVQTTGLTPSLPREAPHGAGDSSARVEPDQKYASGHFAAWLLLACSLVVSSCLVLRTYRRMSLLERLLRESTVEGHLELDALRDLARRFRLRQAPRVLIVNQAISPMLWIGRRGATIVIPQLLTKTGDRRLRHVLAHELAHFARRDHWVNLFAWSATTLCWWNPVAWLARRELRAAAESCCDAMAMQRLDDTRRDYAKTLLAVVDFVTTSSPTEATATAALGEGRFLKRRIEMIANRNVKPNMPRSGWLWISCALVAVTLLPVRAQQPGAAADEAAERSAPRTDSVAPDETAPESKTTRRNPAGTDLGSDAEERTDDEARTDDAEGTDDAGGASTYELPGYEPEDGAQRPRRYRLPDYLPAAHGNMVESSKDHHFMLQPLGDPRRWHVTYVRDAGDGRGRTLWDKNLILPQAEKLKQGDTFVLHSGRNVVIVAFVEDDYVNDRDIGVKEIDTRTGQIRSQCTLLRDMTRYQRMADTMSGAARSSDDASSDLPARRQESELNPRSRIQTRADSARDVQVLFKGPKGMRVGRVTDAPGAALDSTSLVVPARSVFHSGSIFRLELTDIPGHAGLVLRPTIEFSPATSVLDSYLARFTVAVTFSEQDLKHVVEGRVVTKVIYQPQSEYSELALSGVEEIVSTRLDPGVDPIAEADRRGAIIAVLRMGQNDAELASERSQSAETRNVESGGANESAESYR